MTDELSFDQASTALILQDLQNDVISDGGAFADSGAPAHAKSQRVVANVAELASAARSAGIPVIHIHFIVEPGATELKMNAPLFRGIREARAVVRGTWGAAPVDGLAPVDGDYTLEKVRMNGFFGTKLDNLLRALGTTKIILTGAWTNMSIEHTARHAADAGYEVFVASDGTSSVNDDWQRASLEFALTNVAQTPSCAELIKAM
jgi:gluconolactonase